MQYNYEVMYCTLQALFPASVDLYCGTVWLLQYRLLSGTIPGMKTRSIKKSKKTNPAQPDTLSIRLTKPQKQKIVKAAKTQGKSLAEFVRTSCLSA